MSIIIMSQSLKNDGYADIQVDGECPPKSDCSDKINAFYGNLDRVKLKKHGAEIKYGSVGLVFFIKVICEERDVAGRASPICIQANILEISKIPRHLDSFLQKSGRTISAEKRKCVKKIVESKSGCLGKVAMFCTIPIGTYCVYRILK